MILDITSKQTGSLSGLPRPNKWDVADACRDVLPRNGNIRCHRDASRGESEDDRIGLFMALAAAVCAWEMLGGPRR